MTAKDWTSEELDRIASAEELHTAPVRGDGTLARKVRAARGSGAAHINAGGVAQDVELIDAEEPRGEGEAA